MRAYKIYIMTMILGLATACSEGSIDEAAGGSAEGLEQLGDGNVAQLSLCAVVDGYELTRSGGKESWSLNDKVEVAYEMTSQLSTDNVLDFGEYQIVNTSTGQLEPVSDDDEVLFVCGEDNSYFAIYPEGLVEENSNYLQIDLTDQTGGVDDLDLLYATTKIQSQDESETSLNLTFTHQYSLIEFNLSSTLPADATVTLCGAYSKAEFNITTGLFESAEVGEIKLPTMRSTVEVLLLPWQNVVDIELVVYNNSKVTIFKPDVVMDGGNVTVWESNKKYEYSVTL